MVTADGRGVKEVEGRSIGQRRLQVSRSKTRVPCYPREHPGADFIAVVEGKDEVVPLSRFITWWDPVC